MAVSPENGWEVVRNSSTFNVRHAEGDWNQSFVSDDGNVVRYRVTTLHIGAFPRGHDSGKVVFTIKFKEQRKVDTVKTESELLTLRWGDTVAFNYTAGTWTLLFQAFDGSSNEFAGSEQDNKFITIANKQGSMIVGTVDPAKLVFP